MKKLSLIVSLALAPAGLCLDRDAIERAFVRQQEAATREILRQMAEAEPKFTIERAIVVYIVVGEDKVAPAFLTPGRRTLHRWEGVVLNVADVPEIHGWPEIELRSPPVIWPHELPDLKVESIAPPVRYLRLDDGRFVRGYYDHTFRILYENSRALFEESELPKDAAANKLILDRSFDAHRIKRIDGTLTVLMPVPRSNKRRPQVPRKPQRGQ